MEEETCWIQSPTTTEDTTHRETELESEALVFDGTECRGPEKTSPSIPPFLRGAFSDDADVVQTTPPSRDEHAREALGLAPTMSARDACMRVLVRRCALTLMRAATVVLFLLFARSASAHSLDIGYLRVDHDRVVLDLDRVAAAQMLDAPNATIHQLKARAVELASKTYAREAPEAAAGACTFDAPAMEVTDVTVRLVAAMHCPDGERTWRFPFVTDTHVSPTFELLVKDVASDRMTVVDRATPEITFGAAATARSGTPARASAPRPGGQGRSMFLVGGLLVGVMLAPLARFALRR